MVGDDEWCIAQELVLLRLLRDRAEVLSFLKQVKGVTPALDCISAYLLSCLLHLLRLNFLKNLMLIHLVGIGR